MEFVAGRRESNYYSEEEETQPLLHHPPFAIPPPPSSSSSFSFSVQKEHMFDKVVTPSDVGKLNRLVIPKQHAERYFPLDASAGEKGLLLTFEDHTGKHWRFRYSYWNSSQSYVMTKGWSRFVKEKHLDAGDTVSFGRGVGEAGRCRFFIDWKRRPELVRPDFLLPFHPYHHLLQRPALSLPRSGVDPWERFVVSPPASAMTVYDNVCFSYSSTTVSNPYLYLRSAGNSSQIAVQVGAGNGDARLALPVVSGGSVPAVRNAAAAGKTVRLFGVNLGCCSSSEAESGSHVVAHGRPPPPLATSIHQRPGALEMECPPTRRHQQPVSLDLEI